MQKSVAKSPSNIEGAGSDLLPIEGKTLSVARGGRALLAGVDVSISGGSGITVVLGPNGAGKSLLIRILAGLITPDSGAVTWAGSAPDRERMPRIGFVFQRPVHLDRTAFQNIVFALKVTGAAHETLQARAQEALVSARLEHLANQPARALSLGEQQQLAMARAVACQPGLFILDEPTASLDPASTAAIESMLRSVRETGTPVVLVTHDIAQARRLADDVIFMHRGRIVERTPAVQFLNTPKSPEAAAFVRGEIVV